MAAFADSGIHLALEHLAAARYLGGSTNAEHGRRLQVLEPSDPAYAGEQQQPDNPAGAPEGRRGCPGPGRV